MKKKFTILATGSLLFYMAAPAAAMENKEEEKDFECMEGSHESIEIELLESEAISTEACEENFDLEHAEDERQQLDVLEECASTEEQKDLANEEVEELETEPSQETEEPTSFDEEDREDEGGKESTIGDVCEEPSGSEEDASDGTDSEAPVMEDPVELEEEQELETAPDSGKTASVEETETFAAETENDHAESSEPVEGHNDEREEENISAEHSESQEEQLPEEDERPGGEEGLGGNVHTASAGGSSIIDTDIEIETIEPSSPYRDEPSRNEDTRDREEQDNAGDRNDTYDDDLNKTEGRDDSVYGNNSSYNNNSSGSSGIYDNDGIRLERLPKTGGFMDQSRMLFLGVLLILAGASMRIFTPRRRTARGGR